MAFQHFSLSKISVSSIQTLLFSVCGSFIYLLSAAVTFVPRLISAGDVRNYLSHIIYVLIFDFFLNFLLFVRLQTPTSSRCWKEV